MKNRTFTNRITKETVELSNSEIRRIRKDVRVGKLNKLELPYEASDINRIFAWEAPISDSNLGKPAKIEVVNVEPETSIEVPVQRVITNCIYSV